MTAAPEDADLGLNLVFSTPSVPAGGGGTGANNGRRKRNITKYDRRRERGRLAKEAREDEKSVQRRSGQQQQHRRIGGSTGGGNGESARGLSSSLAGIAAALSGGSRSGETKQSALGAPNPKPASSTESVSSKTDVTSGKNADAEERSYIDDVTKNHHSDRASSTRSPESASPPLGKDATDDPEEVVRPTDGASAPKAIHASSTALSKETVPPASLLLSEEVTASSRRHRAHTLQSEEQRAKYLSEFHARPRDMDRDERASSDIKASRASDHIFGEHGANADNDVVKEGTMDIADGEMAENAKDDTTNEGVDTAESAATSCPFRKLGLHPNLVSALTSPSGSFRLSQPTIVQSRSVLALLPKNSNKKRNKKKDKQNKKLEQNLFIQSETGSGKTLAYLLPIMQHLAVDGSLHTLKRVDRRLGGTRCVLLCPTRELATQTYVMTNNLCNGSFPWIVPGCFSGGEKRKSEKARLRKGISILIATPGRLLDHLTKTESLLSSLRNRLEWLVLDEADRLLDAGLGGQVEQIVQRLRSNQPGAGPARDGVTWRSVLVSATVAPELEGLARTVLGGDGDWAWARGHASKGSGGKLAQEQQGAGSTTSEPQQADRDDNELDNAAPRQLAQLYMIVSAKLRLSSLIAFLAARASKGERTVVFLSTCDSVDYHHALFASMESILGDDADDDGKDESDTGGDGIFGKRCPIFKLHGDIPHNKRQATLKAFSGNQRSAILLATDVAARGLNFPSLDWIVQYDPPCETKDYVHRAGRSARAGQAGHALLFLLPSERQYVEVLQLRGLKEISALSLSSTLTAAAQLCRGVAQEGEAKASGNTFSDGRGEAFTTAIQNRLEQRVLRDDVDYKASIEKKSKGDPKQKRRKRRKDAIVGPLLEGARRAFSAFVRAYPAKERAVRHIFNARALHLGHMARSLALKETPKMVSKGNNSNTDDLDEGSKPSTRDKGRSGKGEKRKSRLAFGNDPTTETDEDAEYKRDMSLLGDAIGGGAGGSNSGGAFPVKKKKLSPTGGGGKNVQKRMMEAAMLMQAQEFM
eukprot:CAMPEP_0181130304 /NCGR_PEP_ID=MMETSP1071-20121207/29790_1 /TAXON_ID=35127 /ORGANISM="Thalassiosira sp., Strain NH16" /LENGTH=1042 /DNA_ID=CAMNT_0023216361 /DNA_START=19 /DNA_END=3147 /DNA_ORIENTATION=+